MGFVLAVARLVFVTGPPGGPRGLPAPLRGVLEGCAMPRGAPLRLLGSPVSVFGTLEASKSRLPCRRQHDSRKIAEFASETVSDLGKVARKGARRSSRGPWDFPEQPHRLRTRPARGLWGPSATRGALADTSGNRLGVIWGPPGSIWDHLELMLRPGWVRLAVHVYIVVVVVVVFVVVVVRVVVVVLKGAAP